jgi:hypothetical protein
VADLIEVDSHGITHSELRGRFRDRVPHTGERSLNIYLDHSSDLAVVLRVYLSWNIHTRQRRKRGSLAERDENDSLLISPESRERQCRASFRSMNANAPGRSQIQESSMGSSSVWPVRYGTSQLPKLLEHGHTRA